ncbi:subtilisin-like protein [Ganoderma leucocontextum]|nr:subtilisin-like protein [Ganoderma leucocontextum]
MLAAGLLVLFVLAPLALGSTIPRSDLVPRSQLSTIPSGFSPHIRALVLDDHVLRLTIGFPSNNVEDLHAALLDVSDPSSPHYGRHLSKAEVARLASPRADGVKAITDWLGKHGLSPESRSYPGETLTVHVPAARANFLLAANFTAYTHDTTNTTMIRTLSYSLPAYLHDHIAFVYPTTQFDPPVRARAPVELLVRQQPRHRRADSAPTVPASCANSINPQCLQALYGIPTTPATAPGNSLYVSGLGGECANPNDLQTFLAQFRPDIKHGSYTSLAVDGSSDTGIPSDEGNCDTQYSVGLATNVSVTYAIAGSGTDGVTFSDLLETVEYLLALDEPPLVVTTSYVFDEPDLNSHDSVQMALTLCNYYAQLGARGTSVIFASGDGGAVGGIPNKHVGCHLTPFVPSFPSTCPFVTSVGSTQGINPEVAAKFSSGGFSRIFSRPSYQDHAVSRYLQSQGDANAGRYNVSGRAYPDVSTQGANFYIHSGGQGYGFTGTSASSPTFASIIALINDGLLASGRSPLGFLNPLLYSNGTAAFNDITSGDNYDPVCDAGFDADVGWDAVTGLGTPDYNKLLNIVTGHALSEHLQSGAARGLWVPRLMYTFLWTFVVGLLCRNLID